MLSPIGIDERVWRDHKESSKKAKNPDNIPQNPLYKVEGP